MATSNMFPNFQEFKTTISPSVTINGIKSGSGPPLLLIHGFPQTHIIWRKIAPSLSSTFTTVLVDLRGYGESSKPPSSAAESHKPYSKSVMATDCATVMASLGFQKFKVLAHDRGARVAHKLCVDYPERVEKVMLLDIAPTLTMFEKIDQFLATTYWHWVFLIQPEPFPEKAMIQSVETFAEKFLGGGYGWGAGYMSDEARSVYTAQFRVEAGVHAMCEDYRAAATIDLVEARDDRENGRKIRCPVRVLWGRKGAIESNFDCLAEWKAVSDGEVSGEVVDSGHYIPEQVPDDVLRNAREFFN